MQSSREQVRKTLSHQEPDHVIVDFGSTTSTGISAIAYHNLKVELGLNTGYNRVYDPIQQLAVVEDEIMDLFSVDLVAVGKDYDDQPDNWYDVTLSGGIPAQWPTTFKPRRQDDGSWLLKTDGQTVIGKMPAEGAFFDQCHFPYLDGYPDDFRDLGSTMGKVLWGACPRGPWQHKNNPDFWSRLRQAGLAQQQTGRAVVVSVGCNLLEWGMFLRRMDNFLMDLYAEPARVEALLDALLECHLHTLENAVRAVGDIADVFRFGDDLGMDNGPFMSPEVYRKLFKPRHQQLCDYVKQHTDAFTLLHSCGSIVDLIPDLIEAGFDSINPVQTCCRGMEPVGLKQEFGNEMVFWGGGCDTRTILNLSTPDQVKDHTRERLEILSRGGGFVFCTVHNILPEIPPKNIMAMFEAVREFNAA